MKRNNSITTDEAIECLILIWWTLFNKKNCSAFHKAMRNGANERESFDYVNLLE